MSISRELPDPSDRRIMRLAKTGTTHEDLFNAFPDPGTAFIVAPRKVSLAEIIQLFTDKTGPTDPKGFVNDLHRRAQVERWIERRATYQARRSKSRRNTILEEEANAYAVATLDFAQQRLFNLMYRYDHVSAYVTRCLKKLIHEDGSYNTPLKDATKELRELEKNLAELLPDLGLDILAAKYWSSAGATPEEKLATMQERIKTLGISAKSAGILRLVQSANDGE